MVSVRLLLSGCKSGELRSVMISGVAGSDTVTTFGSRGVGLGCKGGG